MMKAMRKIFSSIMIIAAAVMTFASCQKVENIGGNDASAVKVSVRASVQDLNVDTKTYIGTYEGQENTIIWGKGEQMKIALLAETSQIVSSTSTDEFDGENEAYFEFEILPEEEADSYIYGGMYPASAAISSNNENAEAYKVELPATQNASAASYDPAAYIMVARPESFNDFQTDWIASYRRVTALNKITLKNIPEDIVKVEISAPGTVLAGRRYFDLTTGDSGEVYNNRADAITVLYDTPLAGGSNMDVWFTSWDASIAAGSELSIVAYSAAKSYSRTITANDNGIKFTEGCLNTLSVNMSSATIDDLVDYSGQYIIGSYVSGKWVIMSGENSSSYYTSFTTSVEKSVDSIDGSDFDSVNGIDKYIWSVAKIEGGYSFQNNNSRKYLNLTANSNNAHVSSTAVAFELTLENKAATITSKVYPTRVLMYNSGSPRFAFYKGTQNAIYMIPVIADNTPKIIVSSTSLNLDCEGKTEQTITVSGNAYLSGSITASVSSDAQGWLEANVNDGKLDIVAEVNDTEEDRTATITLTADGAASVEISVTQEGKEEGGQEGELKTWTYEVSTTSPVFKEGTPVTVNDATWSIVMGTKVGSPSTEGAPTNSNSNFGWKWGNSKSAYWESYTLSTDYFASKKVKSVTVKFLNNGAKDATMVVMQGSTTIGTVSENFGQTWTDLTADTNQGMSGTLSIQYSVAQASLIHSISVKYYD